MLKGKNFIVGITGGIAAYKTASLVRLLIKESANVKVLMTPLAKEFISPLTMATLAKNPVLIDFFSAENGNWNSHVNLGIWADAYIIAPATANTMGKMANAVANNLLVTTYLSAKCPVFIAPAMDLDMYKHPANQRNMKYLKSIGNNFIESDTGELASGLFGKGRMAEPEKIVENVKFFFQNKLKLKGKKFLITAGATHEKIDPIRFIGNYSTGKMGFAIAEEIANQGGEVILIAGKVSVKIEHKNIKKIFVTSAEEMYNHCLEHFENADFSIMTAAVSDFTPVLTFDKKLKRGKENLILELKPTKDIAKKLGELKTKKQILIAFALESHNEIENAKLKIKNKNLDFIVLNSLKNKETCFESDNNKITIIDNLHKIDVFEKKSKKNVAKDIVKKMRNFLMRN